MARRRVPFRGRAGARGDVRFARGEKAASASDAPIANQDHWHAAFGIDICGEYQENPGDAGPDTRGIHTHQDGLIHIHPFVGAAAGERATFSVFAEQTGIEVTDDSFTLPDGTTYTNGDDCEGEDGDVVTGLAQRLHLEVDHDVLPARLARGVVAMDDRDPQQGPR